MASSRQHLSHEKKYNLLLKELPNYIVDYVYHMENYERSPSTLLVYLNDYKHFLEWLVDNGFTTAPVSQFPESVLESLPVEAVNRYFRELSNENLEIAKDEKKKREKTSINRKKSALRSLFKYLTIEYENEKGEPLFYRNVMQKVPVIKPKESLSARSTKLADVIFHEDTDIDFLYFIKKEYQYTLSSRQLSYFMRDIERDFAILSIFLGTGIRVNELAEIRIRDLNFEKSTISVLRKGNKKDIVKASLSVMEDIVSYLSVRNERYGGSAADHEYLFLSRYNREPSPLSVRAIQDLVTKYTKAFNKGSKRMSPHKLRHTYATKLMDETKDISYVMEQLGHTSESTALLYVHSSQEKAELASEAMDRRRKRLKY
ncbi:tyrosine recombinase XerS [Sutcliffiella horikoshii]|uniref:tyrosine recombinase XerS n=1 Tax=Sutcliffiella horikoshii TaxID=79883 RepID=UPI001CBEB708|nr:tyrosine recombinase XerS [Sutcliffiella horikoshii]